jgi:ABC-type uncharacterized transport system involved in gliding motility auxiliary subunit
MLQRILSILGWVGTALVLAAVAIRFLRPEFDNYATWAAWAGLGLVVLYTLGQWREIVAYFRQRHARYGAVATVGVVVALAIAVGVNYLAARQNKRWDFTANRQNSLAEQTVKLLQSLDAPVKFTVFEQQTNVERFRQRLDAFRYASPRVTVEYIDPDLKPIVAREYQVEAYRCRRLQGQTGARHVRFRAGSDQRSDQGDVDDGTEGVLPSGPRRT